MKQYLELGERVLNEGRWIKIGDTNRLTIYGAQMEFNLQLGFPIVTTKRVWWRGVVEELLWFLNGSTDVTELQKVGVHIWDANAKPDGTIGDSYGAQWRNWDGSGYDQIQRCIEMLERRPKTTRNVVMAWNPTKVDRMALPPCFPGEVLVSTAEGYKKIKNVKEGDIVLSGKGLWRKVNKVWETPYTGRIVTIKTHHHSEPFSATPNHPFLVKDKGWLEADDIEPGDYLAIPRIHASCVPSHPYMKGNQYNKENAEHEFTANDFFVLGYYMGNGWCSNGESTDCRVCFSIPNKKIDSILPRIRETIKVAIKPNCGKNVSTYEVRSKKWIDLFRQFGHKANNKRIPYWVYDAPQEYLQDFLDGYTAADGFVEKSNIQFTTTSRHIAYGLQIVAAKLGRLASVHYQIRPRTTEIEGRIVNQRDTYSIYIRERPIHTVTDEEYVWVEVDDVFRQTIGEPVYNLDVEVDHTFTVYNFVNHNCHFAWQALSDGQNLTLLASLRSSDLAVGLPFNVSSYALLTHILAKRTGLRAESLIMQLSHVHVYEQHVAALQQQLRREPYPLPELVIDGELTNDLKGMKSEQFKLEGYACHPAIQYEMVVT